MLSVYVNSSSMIDNLPPNELVEMSVVDEPSEAVDLFFLFLQSR